MQETSSRLTTVMAMIVCCVALVSGCATVSTDTSTAAPSTTAPSPASASARPSFTIPEELLVENSPGYRTEATVRRVVDGDTLDTTLGRVRLIGIDTPERGECNYQAATDYLESLVAASDNRVVLVVGGGRDDDRYGRLLRYVDTPSGQDLNLAMIESGYATARYDSRDGYGRHPREDAYVSADANATAPPC